MHIHKSVTPERVERAVMRSRRGTENPGFCIACGKSTEGVEPDARKYLCHACLLPAVYGAEELLIMIAA